MDKADQIFSDSLDKSFSSVSNPDSVHDLSKHKLSLGEEKKPKKIKYVKPNFKKEFSELKRYRDLEDMSMEDWLVVAENGEVVNFDEIKDDLKNVKFDLDKISDKKKDRFEKHFEGGVIRLPTVVELGDDLYLLGGNTRITGLLAKGKKPKVWLIKFNEKTETKETTSSGSSGQYSAPMFSKIEATEATTTASVGSYVTPAMWAKSTNKKDFRGASKTQIPGGQFVKVKAKCKSFPYCNQGDIGALKIYENEIKKYSSELGIEFHVLMEYFLKKM